MATPEELLEQLEKDLTPIVVKVEENSAKVTSAQNDTIIAEMVKKYIRKTRAAGGTPLSGAWL
jgi:hypothetical protein